MFKGFCYCILFFAGFTFSIDDEKDLKKTVSQQGLITTVTIGDIAPISRYVQIVSLAAFSSAPFPSIFTIDTVGDRFYLSSAFCSHCTDKLFRFYKDPYDPFYRLFFDKDHQQCIDVSLALIDPNYAPFISTINYGWGQNFYLRYYDHGRYKIFHSSGKILALNPNEKANPRIQLIEDNSSEYAFWCFVDPVTKKILLPEDF